MSVFLPIGGKIALQNEQALEKVSHMAFWLVPTSILVLIGVFFFFKNEFKKAFLCIAFGWIIIIPTLFLIIYPVIVKENPVAKIEKLIQNKDEVAIYKRFDAALPINFKRTYSVFRSKKQIDQFFKENPNGYLITNARNLEELKHDKDLYIVFERKALFENHTTRVFKKHVTNQH